MLHALKNSTFATLTLKQNNILKFRNILTAFIFSVLLTGCKSTPSYTVGISSINDPASIELKKYTLFAATPDEGVSRLVDKEYRSYMDGALQSLGFEQAKRIIDSEIIIFMSYGIEFEDDAISPSFVRTIYLDAVDAKSLLENQEREVLWETRIVSVGKSGDLREVFPVLVAASKPYIGKNTRKTITVKLKENDSRVLEVKGISTKQSETE